MSADPASDYIREFAARHIARYEPFVVHAPTRRRGRYRPVTRYRTVKSGWNPIEAIAWAADRDKVDAFRWCVALYRACSDAEMRKAKWHQTAHAFAGVTACIGWKAVTDTGHSLGFSDERIKRLVDQLDAESAAVAGLAGSGEA